MAILGFLIDLSGAIMLLLASVAMVRRGIEGGFGTAFTGLITRAKGRMTVSAAAGTALAVILQSSAAVTLLVAGFCAGGFLGAASGLAVVLGADLGSALVVQILSFPLEWLSPLLLSIGGWLYAKAGSERRRQIGAIVLGIALVLISLRLMREVMIPIRESHFLPSIAQYLANDHLSAFLAGAVMALVMHSSVATVLVCATLAGTGALPLTAGVSLVLGANLGSALIPSG